MTSLPAIDFTALLTQNFCSFADDMDLGPLRVLSEPCFTTGVRYAAVVGVVGAVRGRVLIEVDEFAMAAIGLQMSFGEELADQMELCLALAEFGNMFAGKVTSVLNNQNRELDLRLTPPAVFSGRNLVIKTPNLNSVQANYRQSAGLISVGIALEGM